MRPPSTIPLLRPNVPAPANRVWSRHPRLWLGLSALAVAGLLALLNGCPGSKPAVPATYDQKVSTFTIGTVALESNDPVHTETYLKKFTEMAPEEPAGWADLALAEIRKHTGQYSLIEEHLKKASDLAPDNADILKIQGLLATYKGDSAGAIAAYQKAVQLAPDDLRARYALIKQLESLPGRESEMQQQYQEILNRQPYNLVALIDSAHLSAKLNDKATLQKRLDELTKRARTFSPDTLTLFKKVQTQGIAADLRPAANGLVPLKNLLQQNIAYSSSFVALARDTKEGEGDPLLRFVKLENPTAKPAAPDTALTFTPASFPASNGKVGYAGVVYLTNRQENPNGAPPPHTVTPVKITSNGRSAQLESGKPLAFPGGATNTPPGPHGVLAMDFNYDGRNDLVFAGAGGVKFYQQQPDDSFKDVTATTKLPPAALNQRYTGAWAVDIEADGDLDIVLGSETGDPTVLRNNGDDTWKIIHPFAKIYGLMDFDWADLDGDGNPDAILVDGAGRLHVFANQRAGLFQERKLPAKAAAQNVAAVAVGDITNDGRMDVIALQTNGAIIRLSDKDKGSDFEISEIAHWQGAKPLTPLEKQRRSFLPPSELQPGAARLFIADLDNNGGLDIIASTAKSTQVWLCDAKAQYPSLGASVPASVFAVADVDKDGRLDLIGLDAKGSPTILHNSGAKNYHWQDILPVAADSEYAGKAIQRKERQAGSASSGNGDKRINSFGIGGEMEIRAGQLYEKQTIAAPVVHFGLGDYTSVDVVRLIWPNGDVRAEFADSLATPAIQANMAFESKHRLTGSCPFLFTWNGKQFVFVTDCIWRSPLGLKINAQDTAASSQTEDWVKIRGDQLVPDAQGMYDLRVTAELWETHFFDHLSLLTVDHPIGTEIWVDERFSMTPPEKKVYVTEPLQPIQRAVDDNGTDVTDILAARDGKHLDTFGRGEYQGVTRDHWVEIELPERAPRSGPLWLVCYGWIHPTDSSINVAIGQGHKVAPQGLSLETPDAQGKWTVARPGLGFPEGKVKTILINLDGVFKPGAARKLRLRTNLEIYWDAIQWAAGQPQIPLEKQRLSADAAELHYRGFSVIKAASASSPELPVAYDQLESKGQPWRDLIGYCTRYGDVKELLTKVDDRYVIMNAGDEMRLLFKAPPPPPAGKTRDFVLIADGWEKDGNFNTTFSKTVLPLPTHKHGDYSKPPRNLEDDPVYQAHKQDWQTYHTRYVTPDVFARGIKPGR